MATVKVLHAARPAASRLIRKLRFPDPVMERLATGPLRFELVRNPSLSDRLWNQVVSPVRDRDELWALVPSATTPARVRTVLEAVDEIEFLPGWEGDLSLHVLLSRVLDYLPLEDLSEELVWAVADRAPESVQVGVWGISECRFLRSAKVALWDRGSSRVVEFISFLGWWRLLRGLGVLGAARMVL